MMGFTDFESTSTSHYFTLDLIFDSTVNGKYAIKLNPQYPNGYLINQPVSTFGITMFYLSILACPGNCYYY